MTMPLDPLAPPMEAAQYRSRPADVPEVSSMAMALASIEAELVGQEHLLSQLEERLTPVSLPMPPTDNREAAMPTQPACSMVTDQLRQYHSQVIRANRRLESILHSLDVPSR